MNENFTKEVKMLSPFTRFIWTIGELPSSYLLSMTYEEQLIWLCNYLEKTVIPTVNNNGEAIIELQDLYVQLKEYVDNYFENLDVQEEINNKLDEMAESGELVNIISAYLEISSVLAFDTVADMKDADNLLEGSTCKTLGYSSYTDKNGQYYRIRQLEESDVIDEINLIALTNYPTLVAELVRENVDIIYETLQDLLLQTSLYNGLKVKTLGYYTKGDNGGGYYLIRDREVSDTPNGGDIVAIGDNLVAELIVENIINVKQFGAYGDGTHDDSTAIQNAFTYCGDHSVQLSNVTKSNPTIFFPYGKYLIETAINCGFYSVSIKGQQSILLTENNANNAFNFGDYSMHPLYIEGIVFSSFDKAININALNIDRSRSEISKCEFWDCNTAIFNNNPSAILNVEDCTFTRCDKIINNYASDCVIFETCWFSDKVYANNEDVSILHNSGMLGFENCFFIPAGSAQTASKTAWIEMTSTSSDKRLFVNNCRISAEPGYKTLVNYKVDSLEQNEPGKYSISVTNCPILAGSPFIRLYKLCNKILIENNNFQSIGNKIIDLDSSFTITDDSYGGIANGFMYDNRIIIRNNNTDIPNDYNNYPESLVDITESDFTVFKTGSTVPFYLGNYTETPSAITARNSFLVQGKYWYDGVGVAGSRIFTGLVHLYSSGGYLYAKYQNLSNDNTNLTVSVSLSGTEIHDGNVTETYNDVERIFMNGGSYYLKLKLNVKSNYTTEISLKRL